METVDRNEGQEQRNGRMGRKPVLNAEKASPNIEIENKSERCRTKREQERS